MSHDPLTHKSIDLHSRLIRDVRRGHSRGPPASLLGVAAMARGQLTLEHARGPQRVEDRSVRSGVGVIRMLCMHHRGT